MSVEVKAARERSGYPPSLAVAENRRCQHFGALDGHFVAMGSLLTYLLTGVSLVLVLGSGRTSVCALYFVGHSIFGRGSFFFDPTQPDPPGP